MQAVVILCWVVAGLLLAGLIGFVSYCFWVLWDLKKQKQK
jgi:hypothetical protein